MKITVLSGTNRPNSNTKKVATYAAAELRKHLSPTDEVAILDLVELPPETFTPSSYSQPPAGFEKFKDLMISPNGILVVIPEYNGSAPGALKYLIDLLPFPESLHRKPVAFIGLSDGRFGALRAVEHTQQIWGYRNAFVFPERVFIPAVGKSLDETGAPKDPFVKDLLQTQLKNFIEFVKKLS